MMDPINWPWRKKSCNRSIMRASAAAALDISLSNSSFEEPAQLQVPSDKIKTSLSRLENALPAADPSVRGLAEKLEVAKHDLLSRDAMVKHHAKVAQEAVSGWEKAEAEAISLRRELNLSMQHLTLLQQDLDASVQQRSVMEGRVLELDEALKGCMEQARRAREDQEHKLEEAIIQKTQEWDKVKAEMSSVEVDLRQRMMAAEAQNHAMTKSLHERAKAIIECQQGKARAELEVGLLQVKLESQAMEMKTLRLELDMMSKELEIRNGERDRSRKAADAAHKQHLEDVKKITKLDSECQRLRNLVRKKLPGPAAVAQMKMEANAGVKGGQIARRKSLGSCNVGGGVGPLASRQDAHNGESASFFHQDPVDLASRLLVMEEETKILKEALAKRTSELHLARQMCARTANKLSVAEEHLESLQGTPTSVQSSRNGTLDSFIPHSETMSGPNSERLDDEVSCAESWASALITELAHFKNVKHASEHLIDSYEINAMEVPHDIQTLSLDVAHGHEVQKHVLSKETVHSAQDYLSLKTMASKDAQLQSANLMCKDVMASLASAEAKLGGAWISGNPRSNVGEGVNSIAEANDMMSKLDKILDDIWIAVASVGDATDEDDSNSLKSILFGDGKDRRIEAAPCGDSLHINERVEFQAKQIANMQTQLSASEAAKADLERQLCALKDELYLSESELAKSRVQIGELETEALDLQSRYGKLLADEEEKRAQLETEVSKLHRSAASLTIELASQHKEYEAAAAKCEALDQKLQGYVDKEHTCCYVGKEHNAATSCRFGGETVGKALKEREMMEAKEKLAECQQTILMLGKQLKDFTSSPLSTSFNSTAYVHKSADWEGLADGRSRIQNQRLRPPVCTPLCTSAANAHANNNIVLQPADDAAHFSNPRRIYSDLSYRRGTANYGGVQQCLMSEHLQQMEDGMSSIYDSLPDSLISSPSSLSLSPTTRGSTQRNVQAYASGARTSLAKSLERAAPKSNGDGSIKQAKTSASSSLSRFFGRSRK